MTPPIPATAMPGSGVIGVPLAVRDGFLLWLVLFLLQFLLWTNPGYYSHDELQWGGFAAAPTLAEVPWVSWIDVAAFQYRPLTFNLWLLLSRALFDSPLWFHALFVGLGTLNAVLLAQLVRALPGTSRAAAAGAALVFVSSPTAAFVHGWVATLADLIWVGCGLLAALHLARRRRPSGELDIGLPNLLYVSALVTAALLAKEAAVVLPGFVLLAFLVDGRRRAWLAVLAAAALPVAIYLGLRLSVILFAPREAGSYAWSLAAIPERTLEYLGYPFSNRTLEVGVLVHVHPTERLRLAAGMIAIWAAIAWRAPRVALFTALGMLGSLAPVLILAASANQYAYAFSAVLAGGVAAAWPALHRPARALVAVLLLLQTVHGVQVQHEMRQAGRRAAVFLPAVTDLTADHVGPPLRVWPGDHPWLYVRLTHDVSVWRHKPLAGRVVIVDAPPADYRVDARGVLLPYVAPDPSDPAPPDSERP